MEQKQILLANREEANYLERKGVDLSKYTRVDQKKFTPPKELEKQMERYTANSKPELDDDIFQEVVKILAKERKKIEKKKGHKNEHR